jgi:hypothetical protein
VENFVPPLFFGEYIEKVRNIWIFFEFAEVFVQISFLELSRKVGISLIEIVGT